MVFPPSNNAMANRMLSWKTRSLVAFMIRSMTRSDAPSRSRWHCTSINDISALLKPPEVIQTHKNICSVISQTFPEGTMKNELTWLALDWSYWCQGRVSEGSETLSPPATPEAIVAIDEQLPKGLPLWWEWECVFQCASYFWEFFLCHCCFSLLTAWM